MKYRAGTRWVAGIRRRSSQRALTGVVAGSRRNPEYQQLAEIGVEVRTVIDPAGEDERPFSQSGVNPPDPLRYRRAGAARNPRFIDQPLLAAVRHAPPGCRIDGRRALSAHPIPGEAAGN